MTVTARASRLLSRIAARAAGTGSDHPVAAAAAAPASPLGSRSASMFFDAFPRFYGTSSTAASRGRLNLRYEAIIAENRDLLAGARVLDIASHDGRWSLAALSAGAAEVVGIEARPELVASANDNLSHYGIAADRYRFLVGDVHDVLAREDLEVDVVMCLGFLYHTLRYNELLHGIRRTGARAIIIDTQSRDMMNRHASVHLFQERVQRQSAAVSDRLSREGAVLSGRPNLAAIATMLDSYGYRVDRLSDWAGLVRDNPHLGRCRDYARRARVTVRCVDVRDALAERNAAAGLFAVLKSA
jgi:hypothetical protein